MPSIIFDPLISMPTYTTGLWGVVQRSSANNTLKTFSNLTKNPWAESSRLQAWRIFRKLAVSYRGQRNEHVNPSWNENTTVVMDTATQTDGHSIATPDKFLHITDQVSQYFTRSGIMIVMDLEEPSAFL